MAERKQACEEQAVRRILESLWWEEIVNIIESNRIT